jgi:predicted acylesterase/phospholipase RssA
MTNGETGSTPRRSLILAGGGMKVAWQAGALQVLLDEAGLSFDHADGASGGVFQLAMWCQGMSGTEIADNWRRIDPAAAIAFNLAEDLKLLHSESLFTLDGIREKVLPRWGLDWEKIRNTPRNATFNVYNFSKQRLEVVEAAAMTESLLCAAVSLPMWFPPVVIGGDYYIDAVFNTDANLEEAIRRGADELWVIWTVSQRGAWNPGFVATYFQIIEAAANGRYNAVRQRIDANNRAIARGAPGEFGRPITVRELRGEVPLHYLVNLSADRFQEAVNMGVRAAREWCVAEGIPLAPPTTDGVPDKASIRFTEELKGFLVEGESDPQRAALAPEAERRPARFEITITVEHVHDFITTPAAEAGVVGWLDVPWLGGRHEVRAGTFNLFVDQGDPTVKRMLYRLFVETGDGCQATLSGYKTIVSGAGHDVWHDTTTLYTRIFSGHVTQPEEAGATVLGAGILSVHFLDFLRELTTFRAESRTELGRASALARFGTFFLGELWSVYGQRVLEYGPW